MKKFRELSLQERTELLGIGKKLLERSLAPEDLERIGENPAGVHELPIRILDRLPVNGREYTVPLVTEEASVVAGACYGAKLCRLAGGIQANVTESLARAQVLLTRPLKKFDKRRLLEKANEGHKHSRAVDIIIKNAGSKRVLEIVFDPGDAMGAAVASSMAEAVSEEIGQGLGRVVCNKYGRRVRASVRIPVQLLERKHDGRTIPGEEVARRIQKLSEWAESDPDRAVTHNKGIMNGITAVALATGQDTRAIEAACHAHAAANGDYSPLSRWRVSEKVLEGTLEAVLPCGIVGGELKTYPKTRIALEIMGVRSANELAQVMAGVGLAQNLAALSMLATIGVTKGHGGHRIRLTPSEEKETNKSRW